MNDVREARGEALVVAATVLDRLLAPTRESIDGWTTDDLIALAEWIVGSSPLVRGTLKLIGGTLYLSPEAGRKPEEKVVKDLGLTNNSAGNHPHFTAQVTDGLLGPSAKAADAKAQEQQKDIDKAKRAEEKAKQIKDAEYEKLRASLTRYELDRIKKDRAYALQDGWGRDIDPRRLGVNRY